MKKSFTLIEVLISVTLFSIIIVFLYNTLDLSKKSNIFYANKLKNYSKNEDIKKLFYEDILNIKDNNSSNSINIFENRDKNSIISFITSNTFHNDFYNKVTYFLSKNNELLRVQSKNPYNKKSLNKFKYDDNKFIDIVKKDIYKFKVYFSKNKKDIIFYIQDKKSKKQYISIKL